LVNEVRQKVRDKIRVADKIKDLFTNVQPTVLETNTLSAIEEQWAMFLLKINDGKSKEYVDKEYDKFQKQIMSDYKNDKVIRNPYYHIAIGNDLVFNASLLNNTYDEAKKSFNRAIELDK
jgi:hypothetical protein